MNYALTATVNESFAATRSALADQGFGVLTEIDLAATLKAQIDADIPPQVILGASRVCALAADTICVEAMAPQAMVTLTGNPDLADARARLTAALDPLTD